MSTVSNEGLSREERMVVLERDENGKPTVWCDPEIADIVGALNSAGVRTIASCSGHGYRPGSIALADGRWLVIAKDDAEFNQIETIFPTDINGEPTLRAQGGVCGQVAFNAVLSCPHEIDHDRVVLKVDHSEAGNALAQLHARLSSLEASPAPVSEEIVERLARSHYDQRMGRAGAYDDAPPGTQAVERGYAATALAAKGGQ